MDWGTEPCFWTMRTMTPSLAAAWASREGSIVMVVLSRRKVDIISAMMEIAISCGVTALMGSPMGEWSLESMGSVIPMALMF